MNSHSFARLILAMGLSFFVSSLDLQAEFIQPIAVLASNGEASQDTLINGEGFDEPGVGSPAALHSRDGSQMWSVVGSIKADATFDLGQTLDLTKVYIWNYNVADSTDIGMKDVEILVSSGTNMETATFTAIADITLKEGGQTNQTFNVVGTNVRLVKLHGLSNWGHGWSVGLAEVRFESGDITGNVPSIVINNPHEGDVIPFGSNVSLDATITDADRDILKVEFFDGATKLGEKTVTPYSWAINTPPQGEHAYRVLVTDRSGKVSWSTVNVVVREFVADRIDQIDDTADEGDGLNQIHYEGTWNLAQGNVNDPRFKNNDHYSDVRNAYFEVRFQGVKIDVYATVASHHGNGIATIDGGTEYTVSYKAAQRKEQALVWSSPILPNREHVLRVRVAGTGVVTADRFDVHVKTKPDVEQAVIKKVTASLTNLVVEVEDVGASVVDPATVKLLLDNSPVNASVVKGGSTTTLTYKPALAFLPGSVHAVSFQGKDATGASLTNSTSFTLPAPYFPLSGLGGPYGTAGNWGIRQIWNAGRADALVSAVDIALKASQAGFTNNLQDTNLPVINLAKTANPGAAGIFADNLPLPAEAQGLTESDFVIVARAKVAIPRSGDWTIGVHSDEGFALRFIGAPFASVNGNGVRDDNYPEYMAVPVNTADSNTRGILKGIAAGTYELEFISWERVGSASYEIYAAEGAFEDDTATDQWQLIGSTSGLQLVASGPKLTVRTITKLNNRITVEFVTPEPDRQHQLLESLDLKSWQPIVSVTLTKTGNNTVVASLEGVTGPVRYYRVALPGQ